MHIGIVSALGRIEALQAKASLEVVRDDPELQATLASFLCVLSSDLIEQAVISILDEYASKRGHANVARYVRSGLSRLTNAKFEDILVTLARFDPEWRRHFENTGDDVKSAIDSIVNNRNQIAHGKQVGISLVNFIAYHSSVKRFLAELDTYLAAQ